MNKQELNGKTTILYARASTQEQSCKVQLEQLRKFCNENEIKIIDEFEENVSGAKEHREKLEIILNSEPKADLLIVREISRISREEDYLEALEKVRTLSKKYTIYILLDDYLIRKGEIIELSAGITMMVKLYGAADEREKIKDRTKTARDKYRQNPINVYCGNNHITFGLMKVPNPTYQKGVNTKQIWVKNPETWNQVEEIFKLKCEGYSNVRISQITGISLNIVYQTLKNRVVRYYIPESTLLKADKAKEINNTNPNPNTHPNKYKNKIFVCDTKQAMTHQVSKKKDDYKMLKDGVSCTIKATIIDEIVKKTIIAMLEFFDLKKQELSADNEAKIQRLESDVLGMMKTYVEKAKQEDDLGRKFIKAPNEMVEKMITEQINAIHTEREKMFWQVEAMKEEINRLRSIDYSGKRLTITEANFPDFINKYIRRIECWHQKKFHQVVKVYVNPEYIQSNFFDYKMFNLFNNKYYRIEEARIPEAAQTVYHNTFSWDCKYLSLPYYTPEQIEEMFGNQN